MKTVISGLVAMVVVFLCGCSSYRFQGHIAKTAGASEPCERTYYIGAVVLRVDRGSVIGSDWDGEAFREIRIRRDAMKRNPKLFTRLGKGVPLAVTVRVYGDPKGGDGVLLPYFLTLGICPLWIGADTPCEITVAIEGAPEINQSCTFQVRSDLKMSATSPLGWIPFERVPSATSSRRDSGIMTAPGINSDCRADSEVVFVETVVDGIEACVREIEKRTPPDVFSEALLRLPNVPYEALNDKELEKLDAIWDDEVLDAVAEAAIGFGSAVVAP